MSAICMSRSRMDYRYNCWKAWDWWKTVEWRKISEAKHQLSLCARQECLHVWPKNKKMRAERSLTFKSRKIQKRRSGINASGYMVSSKSGIRYSLSSRPMQVSASWKKFRSRGRLTEKQIYSYKVNQRKWPIINSVNRKGTRTLSHGLKLRSE